MLHEQGNDCETALKSPREAERVLQSPPAVYVTCLVCTHLAVCYILQCFTGAPNYVRNFVLSWVCAAAPTDVDRQKGNFFSQAIPRLTETVHQYLHNVLYSALSTDDTLVLLVCKDKQFLSDSDI